jgi:hypothetical protein
VEGVLSEDEHDALIPYVAQQPEAGTLILEVFESYAGRRKGRASGAVLG